MSHDGTFGHQLFPFIHEMFTSEASDVWESGEMLEKHPLIRWFAATGETGSAVDRPSARARSPAGTTAAVILDLLSPSSVRSRCPSPTSSTGCGTEHSCLPGPATISPLRISRSRDGSSRCCAALSIQSAILSGGSEPVGHSGRGCVRIDRA